MYIIMQREVLRKVRLNRYFQYLRTNAGILFPPCNRTEFVTSHAHTHTLMFTEPLDYIFLMVLGCM